MEIYSDLEANEVGKVIDIDAVKKSIRTILGTRVRSRLYHPNFGSKLHEFVFDPLDELTVFAIESELIAALSSDPRVVFRTINFEFDRDNNILYVNFELDIVGIGRVRIKEVI